MSWKETCPMQERLEFIDELLEGERTMTNDIGAHAVLYAHLGHDFRKADA